MMVLTRLTKKDSFELEDGYTIDNYIGGVYIQVDYEYNDTTTDYVPSNKTQYDLPQNCTEHYQVNDSNLNLML